MWKLLVVINPFLCYVNLLFYRFVDFDSYNLSNSLTFGKSFSKHTLEVVQIPLSAVSTVQGQEGLILPNNLCNFRTRILVKHLTTSVGEPGIEWNAETSQVAYISIFLQSFFLKNKSFHSLLLLDAFLMQAHQVGMYWLSWNVRISIVKKVSVATN